MGEDRDYILKQMEKFIERSDIFEAYLNIRGVNTESFTSESFRRRNH